MKLLLEAATRYMQAGADAKAEALLDWLCKLQADEGDPDQVDEAVDKVIHCLEEQARYTQESSSVLGDTEVLKPSEAQRLMEHPLPYWVERMTVNYLKAHGGREKRSRRTWNLTWPDGEERKEDCFQRKGGPANTHCPAPYLGRPADTGFCNETAPLRSGTAGSGHDDPGDCRRGHGTLLALADLNSESLDGYRRSNSRARGPGSWH